MEMIQVILLPAPDFDCLSVSEGDPHQDKEDEEDGREDGRQRVVSENFDDNDDCGLGDDVDHEDGDCDDGDDLGDDNDHEDCDCDDWWGLRMKVRQR